MYQTRLVKTTQGALGILAILITVLALAGCGSNDVSAAPLESQALVQTVNNSAVADQYRISLIKYVEGNQALRDLLAAYKKPGVLSPRGLPGYREGWKPIEAQFAIENLSQHARRAPDLCAVFTDSGGYTRVLPDPAGCRPGWCGPTYGVTGPMLEPVRGLYAAGGVRYNVLRVIGEVPANMQPVTMTLFIPTQAGNCTSLEMQHMWGEYTFAEPLVDVTFPFDALPEGIPDISNGSSTIDYGDVSTTISNVRMEPTDSNRSSFSLAADVTYTNDGGNDVDTKRYRIYGLIVHESGQNLGMVEEYTGIVPPGIPKTFTASLGYMKMEDYAGTWFYVLFIDAAGNNIGQAQVAMPR